MIMKCQICGRLYKGPNRFTPEEEAYNSLNSGKSFTCKKCKNSTIKGFDFISENARGI